MGYCYIHQVKERALKVLISAAIFNFDSLSELAQIRKDLITAADRTETPAPYARNLWVVGVQVW
ncbi:hypothetical protein CS542_05995 [Pedobacter sp. IW39]|nr:hypothetical protein CS542_05995 [Pedobacter sp. IW39]